MEKILKICFTVIAAAAACCGEAAFWIYPENTSIRTICKAVTAVFILLCAICGKGRREREFRWVMAALTAAGAADVVIVSSFPAGVVLFAIAHICLIILFYKERPLTRRSWLIWAIISACVAAVIAAVSPEKGVTAYGAALYAPILLLMVFTAIGGRGIRMIASFVFLASDLLLVLYNWMHIHPVFHAVYMGLFYAALLMFAWRKEKR